MTAVQEKIQSQLVELNRITQLVDQFPGLSAISNIHGKYQPLTNRNVGFDNAHVAVNPPSIRLMLPVV